MASAEEMREGPNNYTYFQYTYLEEDQELLIDLKLNVPHVLAPTVSGTGTASEGPGTQIP